MPRFPRPRIWLAAPFAALTLSACNARPTPIFLQGDQAWIAALAGDWDGQYWGGASDRRGVLGFSLSGGADTAYGDVTMITPMGETLRPVDQGDQHRLHTRSAQSLRIDVVRVGPGTLAGTLEPYIAPDCDCTASTTFSGAIVGDTLRGTFVTRTTQGAARTGNWLMVRRRATPKP